MWYRNRSTAPQTIVSKTNKIFEKQPVQIQNYSGFDLSHYNLGTLKCGTLVPVLTEPLVPGDKISIGNLTQMDLPPLATNFYGRVDVKLEAFFVPYRILMQQWQKFMRYKNDFRKESPDYAKYSRLPALRFPVSAARPGSLLDYLGFKISNAATGDYAYLPNPLPVLAYHKIYDCWYRDKLLQNPVFVEETGTSLTQTTFLRSLPWFSMASSVSGDIPIPDLLEDINAPLDLVSRVSINGTGSGTTLENNSKFGDGHLVWDLRQRNFAKDYFTTATTEPQAGDPVALRFAVPIGEEPGETVAGSFTIASLRAANSLQKFVERNNLAGDDYADQIQARFGVRPSDAAINYPIFLGHTSYDVYNRSIFQTTPSEEGTSKNPFTSTASEYGKASSMGKASLVDNFTCTEHGVIMVLASLVPHSFYSTGTRKYLYATELADFPEPLLASIGDEPIWKEELAGDIGASASFRKTTFGYTGRYSHVKYHDDEVHGLLRDGSSLEAFAIQRSFGSPLDVELGSSFLEIPTNLMDQVMATDTGLSGFTAWYQMYFEVHKASKLPVFCIPTLGDEPDTHTEYVDKGGKRL